MAIEISWEYTYHAHIYNGYFTLDKHYKYTFKIYT